MKQSSKQQQTKSQLTRRHRRYGWAALFIWLLFGLILETLQGFKVSDYLLDPIRRDFWGLAHFHGVTLALLNLIYIQWAESPTLNNEQRQWASRTLILGSILMPLGFFLGGLIHFEGDPGLGIFLAPAGAFFILFAVILQLVAAWQSKS